MTRAQAAAAGLSLALHLGAVLLMLPHVARRPAVDVPPAIEIEMVDQVEQRRGAQAGDSQSSDAQSSEAQADPARPPDAASSASPDSARAEAGELQARTATPPTPRSNPQPSPSPASRAAVNLGGGARDEDSLLVTGDNVVPPRPDAAFHNRPPAYPADAARRRAEGVVRLVIHVSEAGVPAGIEVAMSSGDASLDRAALEAVALWRFQPARAGGAPVPFDYSLDVAFRR